MFLGMRPHCRPSLPEGADPRVGQTRRPREGKKRKPRRAPALHGGGRARPRRGRGAHERGGGRSVQGWDLNAVLLDFGVRFVFRFCRELQEKRPN